MDETDESSKQYQPPSLEFLARAYEVNIVRLNDHEEKNCEDVGPTV
jgi:hypothetical protein